MAARVIEGGPRGVRPPVSRFMTNNVLAAPAIAVLLGGLLLAAPSATAAGDERDREVERGNQLEGQIQSELKRQEELLERMRAEEAARDAARRPKTRAPADARDLAQRADPRIAPTAPEQRELPLAIFDRSEKKIAAGAWGNPRELEV